LILALDVATRVGWAAGETGATPQFGSVDFASKSGTGEVLSRWRYWLMDRIFSFRPDLCAFESPYIPVARPPRLVRGGSTVARASGPPPMNALTLRRLLAMTGFVEEIAFERGIPCYEATVLDISNYFLGTTKFMGRNYEERRGSKKAATIAACRRLGWEVGENDDAADALGLWAYAEHILAPETSARRMAGAGLELPLHGTLAAPTRQDRIGRRAVS
jgi:crossover junction endodeoxyribonuclease RuvC